MIESEKIIEHKLVELIKLHNGLCIKLLCDQFIGLPDRLCLLPNGKLVFVELKTTGKKPRRIQTVVHNKLRKLGFRVEVIDTTAKVIELIENMLQNEK